MSDQPKRATIDLEEILDAVRRDDGSGFCLACGDEAMGVEPDAHEYECDACGSRSVYGAEEILLRTVA